MSARRFQVVRRLPPVGSAPVVEVAAVDAPSERRIIWPGRPAFSSPPAHPSLPPRLASARAHGVPVWLEEVVPAAHLGELDLPPELAAGVLGAVAEALGALHAAGLAHGDLAAHRVRVSARGEVALVGAGARPGTPEEDGRALAALAEALGVEAFADPRPEALAERARPRIAPVPADAPAILVEEAADADEPTVIPEEPLPDDPGLMRLPLDEVDFDIGPDEVERGLLDTASGSGATGPADRTSAVEDAGEPGRRRVAALARLAAVLEQEADPGRFGDLEGRPDPAIRALVAEESLDPLPLPEPGVPDWPGWEAEPTAEVTAVRVPAPGGEPAPPPPGDDADSARRGLVIFVAGVAITLAAGALATLAVLLLRG